MINDKVSARNSVQNKKNRENTSRSMAMPVASMREYAFGLLKTSFHCPHHLLFTLSQAISPCFERKTTALRACKNLILNKHAVTNIIRSKNTACNSMMNVQSSNLKIQNCRLISFARLCNGASAHNFLRE